MPLPKIATPTYELELPSSGELIRYRPFLVKEEKVLVFALESEEGERYRERYWRDEFHDTVEQIQPIAEKEGITMAELAVGWVLAKPFVSSPIVGATNPTQLDDAIAAVANPLSEQIVAELDEITKKYRTGDDER